MAGKIVITIEGHPDAMTWNIDGGNDLEAIAMMAKALYGAQLSAKVLGGTLVLADGKEVRLPTWPT